MIGATTFQSTHEIIGGLKSTSPRSPKRPNSSKLSEMLLHLNKRTSVVSGATPTIIKRVAQELCTCLLVQFFDQPRAKLQELGWKRDALTLVEEDILRASLLISKGQAKNYQQSQRILIHVTEELESMLHISPNLSQRNFYRLAINSAKAYNQLGYTAKQQGLFTQAIQAYNKALPFWRRLKSEQDYAHTLINLALALALIGEFAPARRHALEALSIYKHLELNKKVTATYNVLAEIEIIAGNYLEAQRYIEQALEHAYKIKDRAGEGVAWLAQAVMYRLQSERPDLSRQQKTDLLTRALKAGLEAENILLMNSEQTVKVYNVLGLIHRELNRVSTGAKGKEHAQQAETNLIKARNLAQKQQRWLDALEAEVGLAWTYYYTKQNKLADPMSRLQQFGLKQAEKSGLVEIKRDISIGVFAQLGRWHILQGVRAMDEYANPQFSEVAKQFTIALEYNALVGPHSQGFQRAVNTIHSWLKELNAGELKVFYEAVIKVAAELDISGEKCHLWIELENAFGPYDLLRHLA